MIYFQRTEYKKGKDRQLYNRDPGKRSSSQVGTVNMTKVKPQRPLRAALSWQGRITSAVIFLVFHAKNIRRTSTERHSTKQLTSKQGKMRNCPKPEEAKETTETRRVLEGSRKERGHWWGNKWGLSEIWSLVNSNTVRTNDFLILINVSWFVKEWKSR